MQQPGVPRRVLTRRQAVGLGLVGAAAVGAGVAGGMTHGAGRTPTDGPIDAERLRRRLVAGRPIPLEWLAVAEWADGADEIVARGWKLEPYPVVRLDLPIDWTTLGMANRSLSYSLHAWHWMGPVLAAYELTRQRRYLTWCLDRAVSWARTFNEGTARGTMAWYDMALGWRGHRLAYLVEHALRRRLDGAAIRVLLTCVRRHQIEYRMDTAFNPRTNHGLFLAAGQLAFTRRLAAIAGMADLRQQARERLAVMTRTQFAADGGHREHSPGYHRMLLGAFHGVIAAGLVDDAEVRRQIDLAEEALGWLVQPNGEILPLGDTWPEQLRGTSARSASPTTDFLLSGGTRGRPDDRRLRVLPDTGYAIVRAPQPRATDDHVKAGYLFLNAAFHSRVHKHADDLSVVWFDRQREILIDAGRYGYVHKLLAPNSPMHKRGYYYSAPERQYVESTRAHNTAEADGIEHLRIGRKPYGSALRETQERAGHFRLTAAVDHGVWRHDREVVFRPGSWLLVTDVVTGQDGREHDYRVWWNLAAPLVPRRTGRTGLVIDLAGSAEPLWVNELGGSALIAPVSGGRRPLRGWRSKFDMQFTPAWSTGYLAQGVRRHTFRTLFHFGVRARTEPFDHPFAG